MTAPQPRIYAFSAHARGGEGVLIVIADDGFIFLRQWVPHEGFWTSYAPQYRADLAARYAAHYPDGYVFEFVPAAEVQSHAGVQQARRLAPLRPDYTPPGATPKSQPATGRVRTVSQHIVEGQSAEAEIIGDGETASLLSHDDG